MTRKPKLKGGKRKHYPAALRKAADNLFARARNLMNMLGHSGTVHKDDAAAVELRKAVDEYDAQEFAFNEPKHYAAMLREDNVRTKLLRGD